MEGRRASSSARACRLLLRVYAAENLRHVSSQGTYCKVTLEESDSHGGGLTGRGSARASLKRLLRTHSPPVGAESDDPLALLAPARVCKTRVQKSPHGKPVWNEKFELPVVDARRDVLHVRIKSARLASAPAVGSGALALRDLALDETLEQWINLFDNSKRPAGRLRIQLRLATTSSSSSLSVSSAAQRLSARTHSGTHALDDEDRDTYYRHPRRTTSSNSAPSPSPSPVPRSNRRGAIIAPPIGGVALFRRSSTLSRSMLEARTSGSTTASDSISSDNSHSDFSNSVITPYTPTNGSNDPADPTPPKLEPSNTTSIRDTGRSSTSSRYTALGGHDRYTAVSRTTALSIASRNTEELDLLASKYMNKANRAESTHTSSSAQAEVVLQPTAPQQPDQRRVSSRATHSSTQGVSLRDLRETNQFVLEEDEDAEARDIVEEQPVSASSSPASSPPSGPSLSEIKLHTTNSLTSTTATKSPKDERSPRTTNTTAVSSDDDEGEPTIEFDFDTGDVRPSTRLPSHMMRSTVTRSSIATSRIDSDDEESEDESEDEPEDDEMDPDGDPDGPRMVLRSTVTRLLRRESVNVIMDVDEEDDDDDEFEMDPFVFDELPILDMRDSLLQIKDVDCTDRPAASAS